MDQQFIDKIRSLCLDLGEVESELELATSRLNFQRQTIRQEIGECLALSGEDKVNIQGFGTVQLTSSGISVKYNTKMLDRLINVLRQSGDNDLADDIEACKETSGRAGTLRIVKEKR